jgi:hypothetical protein
VRLSGRQRCGSLGRRSDSEDAPGPRSG